MNINVTVLPYFVKLSELWGNIASEIVNPIIEKIPGRHATKKKISAQIDAIKKLILFFCISNALS
jgi:hypothetical protein